MLLAPIDVSRSDFDYLYDHLTTNKPPYRNMHLRAARRVGGRPQLRWLHAMYAVSSMEIAGIAAGPDVRWEYRLVKSTVGDVQVNSLRGRRTEDLRDLQQHFIKDVIARVGAEKKAWRGPVPYLPGYFYLQRSRRGMPATHPICADAVRLGVLDQAFVSVLEDWKLQLIRR